jgi:hypothetical protein
MVDTFTVLTFDVTEFITPRFPVEEFRTLQFCELQLEVALLMVAIDTEGVIRFDTFNVDTLDVCEFITPRFPDEEFMVDAFTVWVLTELGANVLTFNTEMFAVFRLATQTFAVEV